MRDITVAVVGAARASLAAAIAAKACPVPAPTAEPVVAAEQAAMLYAARPERAAAAMAAAAAA